MKTLKIDVVTLFPEMIQGAVAYGVLGQAIKAELLSIEAHTPREFSSDKHKSADDRPFGGGDGMLMLAEPLAKTILHLKNKSPGTLKKVIYLSPQGEVLTNSKAKELAQSEHLIFVCGRYGGIDQRIINHHIDEELSIGDYVLSGGELGALVAIDGLARFVPGVLGHEQSASEDSFEAGLLEQPNFTRPREFEGQEVPEILLSGNHKLIAEWKKNVSALVTLVKRPDLFALFIDQENEAFQERRKKKRSLLSPLKVLHNFWSKMSASEKETLGLDSLKEEDFL